MRVLEDQFMIPHSAQKLIDSSAQGIFSLMEKDKLKDITMTEL